MVKELGRYREARGVKAQIDDLKDFGQKRGSALADPFSYAFRSRISET